MVSLIKVNNYKFLQSFFLIGSFFYSVILNSQTDCQNKTKKIFYEIIDAIGNKFPAPPNLEFSKSKRAVAYLTGNKIVIENKVIKDLCSQENFEDKISYVIAHELAHHYLNHNWMHNVGFSYKSTIGNFLEKTSSSKDQRKLAETEADLYAGFFGQIAGYNTLKFAKQVLKYIYSSYNLNKEISGYPTFDERLDIIDLNIEEAKNMTKLYEIGTVLMLLNEYDLSQLFYEDILKNDFNSREIYNNISITYLLKAIKYDKNFSKFKFPLAIDFDTRSDLNISRSNFIEDIDAIIERSEYYISISKSLDKDYVFAQINHLVLNFFKLKRSGLQNVVEQLTFTKLTNKIKNELVIIEMIIDGEKNRRIEKFIKKTKSALNLTDILKQNVEFSNHNDDLISTLKIDKMQLAFGLENFKIISTDDGDLSKYFEGKNYTIYNVDRDLYLVETNWNPQNKNYKKAFYKNKYYYLIN